MQVSDIDEVFKIESTVHKAPWYKELLRDCVLVGYDCHVVEITTDDVTVMGGYIISRLQSGTAHILNFCIAKSMQGKGLGKQFLSEIILNLEKKSDITSIILEVRTSNTVALNLYTGLGFVEVNRKVGYYVDVAGTEDAIILSKELH
jgi:ribosomal-protein-alanine N-acetyltransferase